VANDDDWGPGNEDFDSLYEEFYAGVDGGEYTEKELEDRIESLGDPDTWDFNPTFYIDEEGQFAIEINGLEFELGDQDSFAAIWEWCKDHDIDIEDVIYLG